MERCELRKLAGASSLSDVTNVVYSSRHFQPGEGLIREGPSLFANVWSSIVQYIGIGQGTVEGFNIRKLQGKCELWENRRENSKLSTISTFHSFHSCWLPCLIICNSPIFQNDRARDGSCMRVYKFNLVYAAMQHQAACPLLCLQNCFRKPGIKMHQKFAATSKYYQCYFKPACLWQKP